MPILKPVKGVQASSHHPSLLTVLSEQRRGIFHASRLEQFKHGHHVANHGHDEYLLLICADSSGLIGRRP